MSENSEGTSSASAANAAVDLLYRAPRGLLIETVEYSDHVASRNLGQEPRQRRVHTDGRRPSVRPTASPWRARGGGSGEGKKGREGMVGRREKEGGGREGSLPSYLS